MKIINRTGRDDVPKLVEQAYNRLKLDGKLLPKKLMTIEFKLGNPESSGCEVHFNQMDELTFAHIQIINRARAHLSTWYSILVHELAHTSDYFTTGDTNEAEVIKYEEKVAEGELGNEDKAIRFR